MKNLRVGALLAILLLGGMNQIDAQNNVLTASYAPRLFSLDYQRFVDSKMIHSFEAGLFVNSRYEYDIIPDFGTNTIYQIELLYHYTFLSNARGITTQVGIGYRSAGNEFGYTQDGGYISLPFTLQYNLMGNGTFTSRLRLTNLFFGSFGYQIIPSIGIGYNF